MRRVQVHNMWFYVLEGMDEDTGECKWKNPVFTCRHKCKHVVCLQLYLCMRVRMTER